jgi:hypothetical protein
MAIDPVAAENAVLRNAAQYGANGAALADSRAFMANVAKLDPASGSFGDDLGDAIKAAVESGPRFRAATTSVPNEPRTTAPPARSGADHSGAPAGKRQWTDADVDAATPAEVGAAIEAGLLRNLGFPPSKRRR